MGPDAPCPRCPRCGYDQSGVMATWERSCPLNGVCSECGLDFFWRDLLDPREIGPAWSVEHCHAAAGVWTTTVALVRTWALVHRPSAFWRSMSMHHRVRLPTLWRATIEGILLGYIVFTPVAVGLRTLMLYAEQSILMRPFAPKWSSAWDVALWPLAGPSHTLWLGLWIEVAWVGAWCLFMPLAFVAFRRTLRASRVRPIHIVRITLYSMMVWPLAVLLYSALLVDLPVMSLEISWRWLRRGQIDWRPERVHAAMKVLGTTTIFALYTLFWWRAVAKYLKLRHAFLTALAACTVALLASLIVSGLGKDAWTIAFTFLGLRLA